MIKSNIIVHIENNWYKQDVNDDLHFLEQYQHNSLILNSHENLKRYGI